MSEFLQRFQVHLYLAAIALGAAAGWLVPPLGEAVEPAVTPVLALLLYATFLGIPLRRLGRAFRAPRFLAGVLLLNFVAVPLVVLALVHGTGLQGPLLTGALLVLLAPCVDYVIVFTGLAGGAADRLLATTPFLMLAQILALPVLLRWFPQADAAGALPWSRFTGALVLVVLAPLLAAAVTQWATSRGPLGRAWERRVAAAMVPLMMLTLGTVVASQTARIGSRVAELLPLVPLYLGFAAVMTVLGWAAGLVVGLGGRERRAVLFTGVTRNSLVVLPLALAVPGTSGAEPLAVVTQTLVELLVMVVLVWLVPRLVPVPEG
ncbi:bile acid:sodium symporter [Kocuria tytonis]|uniref:Arsenic resistance protein n=1 Tax=Kocuria tytonis TaxID=2054280 RepID=A0A495AAU2_9MICC|nr:bile acid:sodium symporter [Kocuria tytonis]RKQ36514.1 arsenic resistance protein [Kocuria tytonis]